MSNAGFGGPLFLLVPIALTLITVPLFGGKLGALADLKLRWSWVVPAALGTQILIISIWPSGPEWLLEPLHLGSYLLAGVFVVANHRMPGIKLMAVGGASNLLAIAANGGVMPASRSALEGAGIAASATFENSAFVEHARLAFLGDVFFIPAQWPLSNVFSIGDVLLVAGFAYGVHRICGSRFTPAARVESV